MSRRPRAATSAAADAQAVLQFSSATAPAARREGRMLESRKLAEARYFLAQMLASRRELDVFGFNLSAFLSASRTVLQYARKEASGKPEGRSWYDGVVNGSEVVRFFRGERNANTHDGPTALGGHVNVYLSDSITLDDTAGVDVFDLDGNMVEHQSAGRDSGALPPREGNLHVEVMYRFQTWTGPENVVQLSERYLLELERIVSEGRAAGFLSPEAA